MEIQELGTINSSRFMKHKRSPQFSTRKVFISLQEIKLGSRRTKPQKPQLEIYFCEIIFSGHWARHRVMLAGERDWKASLAAFKPTKRFETTIRRFINSANTSKANIAEQKVFLFLLKFQFNFLLQDFNRKFFICSFCQKNFFNISIVESCLSISSWCSVLCHKTSNLNIASGAEKWVVI